MQICTVLFMVNILGIIVLMVSVQAYDDYACMMY